MNANHVFASPNVYSSFIFVRIGITNNEWGVEMSQHVSFLHAADLHLDSPFSGLTHVPEHLFHDIRESTFTAFENLVETAIEKEVDFVLRAGDLFDNEKQTLKAQIHLRNGFQKLEKHHINVYVSYGNHDFVNGNVHPITYPDNVYEFTEEKVS